MAFVNPERFEGDLRNRPQLESLRGRPATTAGIFFTAMQLLIIITMLRLVMISTGMMFFYIPYYDNAISWAVELMRHYFE
jgi:hypothetical protein